MPNASPVPDNAVHYQLTRSQVVGQWYRLRMLQPKKFVIFGALFICGAALIALQGPKSYFGWTFVAFPFLFAFFFWRGLQNVVTHHPEVIEPRWMSFDESGVVFGSATTRTECAWSRIRKFTQNSEYYLLHLDNLGSAATLPKVSFTPEQREQFIVLAKAIAA